MICTVPSYLKIKTRSLLSVHVFKRTSDYKTRVGYNLVKLQITFLGAFQVTIWVKSVCYCNLEFNNSTSLFEEKRSRL